MRNHGASPWKVVNAMTHRQRALSAMRGEPVDRLPFIGRMDLWYKYHANRGTLPTKYRGWSLRDIQRDLDIGVFGFGAWDISFFRIEYRRVTVRKDPDSRDPRVEYDTPYGTLWTRQVLAEELRDTDVTGMTVEHLFKTPADYDAFQFILEDAQVVENHDAYARFRDEIGEDGLAVPWAGWAPMHQLPHVYMGYETFYYELADNPEKVLRAHDALLERQREITRLATQCPADVVECGGNYDEMMTPPPFFERYIKPYYQETRRTLEAAGKFMAVHGDGEMRELLRLLMEAGVQVVEAITPKPMTSIDVAQTRALWGDRVTFWGGVPAIILTPTFTDAQFKAYLEDLDRAIGNGRHFILGFGDNVPTDALFERIVRVAQFAATRRVQ
jgi:uroporphyrinogen-III decarboxylase